MIFTAPDSVDFGQHQLGPDGKIYVAHVQQYDSLHPANFHLSVINDPNQPGAACNFTYSGLYLGGLRGTLHLPNLPNYNLAPLVAQNAQAGPPQVVICPGDSVHLGYPDTTGGVVTYAWAAHPDIADTMLPEFWVHPMQSTWYYLTVVDSALGIPCGVTRDSIHVVVAGPAAFPMVSLGNDTSVCGGDTFALSANANVGNWIYAWSDGSDSSSTVVAGPGTYVVTVTNPIGVGACFVAADTVVVDTFPEPEFSEWSELAGLDRVLCAGDSVQLGLLGPSAALGTTYLWSLGVLPADTIPAWAFAVGTYVLSIYNPDSLGGCFLGTDTVNVVPFDSLLLPPGFAGNDTIICRGDSVLLGLSLPSQWVGSWSPSTGLLFPDSLLTVGLPTVTTAFVLAATDTSNHGSCATVRDTVRVTVEDPNFPNSQVLEFCAGEVLTVGVSSVSGYSYAWSPVFGLNDPFAASTTVAPLEPIVYTLTVTNDTAVTANCRTREFVVSLSSDGCIDQNVVTPNGDGINDFLRLGSFNGPISLSVYDRWGALVYSSNDYRGDWPRQDGRLPASVYWYVVNVAGAGGKAFVGEVTVLR